jgi:hypothetical protein
MAAVESEYPINPANAPRKHERRDTTMRCLCAKPALNIRQAGESSLDSNVTMIVMQFYCSNCGHPQRCAGVADEFSIHEPWSDDGGNTIMVPLVPEGEEPLMVSMQ